MTTEDALQAAREERQLAVAQLEAIERGLSGLHGQKPVLVARVGKLKFAERRNDLIAAKGDAVERLRRAKADLRELEEHLHEKMAGRPTDPPFVPVSALAPSEPNEKSTAMHMLIGFTEEGHPHINVIDCAGFTLAFAEQALRAVMRDTAGPSGYHAIIGTFEGLSRPAEIPKAFNDAVLTLPEFLGDAPFADTSEPRLIDKLAEIDREGAERLGRLAMERQAARFMPKPKKAVG